MILQKLLNNTIEYNYSVGKNGQITSVKDGAGRITTLTYNASNQLTKITDPVSRTTIFSYDSYGNLAKIKQPDDTYTQFSYYSGIMLANIMNSASQHNLNFNYSGGNAMRVSEVREISVDSAGATKLGQTVLISYSEKDSSTTFRTSGKDDVIDNTDDILTTYLFDNWGRTVSEYSTNVSNSEIYGASMYQYVNDTAEGIAKSNKIKTSAVSGNKSTNLLLNHSFKTSNNWTSGTWGASNSTFTPSVSTTATSYLGEKSARLKVTSTVSGSSKVGLYQNVTLNSKGKYTYSAYVLTDGIGGSGGAFIEVRDSSDKVIKTSRMLTGTTPTAVDRGWQRINITFDIPATGTYKFIIGMADAHGYGYFDCVQLEKGENLSNYNMLVSGGFDAGMTSWSARIGEGTTTFTPTTTTGQITYTGDSSAKMYLYQYVPAKGSASSFILSGWAMAKSVPCRDGRLFGLQGLVAYSDGTTESFFAPFLDNVTEWQYTSVPIVLNTAKTATEITVRCRYDFNCNTVSFDNISLVPDLTQSYSYNSDGKVSSTVSIADQKSTFEYDSNKNLKKVINPSGVYSYTYDANGNIITIKEGGVLKLSYQYDKLNRLTRENNAYKNKSFVYNYDAGGNITSVTEHAYTTEAIGTVTSTISYIYGGNDDLGWKDLLTKYNGTAITYDAIGNPLSYRGMTMTWQNGRQLASLQNSPNTASYTYNADGIRTGKTTNGVTTNFTLDGTKVIRSQSGSNIIYYYYDEIGSPIGMKLNGVNYYYIKNIQGDVIRICDESGNIVLTYNYDAWGNLVNHSGSLALFIANPFRYRGYYYDMESGFYYLNSRYYDPMTRRFINADGLINGSANNDILGYSVVQYSASDGRITIEAIDDIDDYICDGDCEGCPFSEDCDESEKCDESEAD